MKYVVTIGEQEFEIDIREDGDGVAVSVDGKSLSTSIVSDKEDHRFLMLLDAKAYDTEVFRDNGETNVLLHGREFGCVVEDQRLVAIRKAAGVTTGAARKELHAPMPGLVVKVLREVGSTVKKGEPLLVVEAMKMENELKSPSDGVIKEIAAIVGKPVEKGALLVTFED